MELAPTEHVAPTGEEVIAYDVMVAPPLFVGAENVTIIELPETVAWTSPGAFGTVAGVTDDDAEEKADSPAVVMALTLKVYAEPFVNPVTVQVVSPEVGLQVPATVPVES